MTKSENNLIKINKHNGGPRGFVFFTAFLGAAIYFVNHVDGFWNIILAVLKAFVWPAILIYNLLQSFTA